MNTKKYIVGVSVVATMLVGVTSLVSADLLITPGEHIPTTSNIQATPVEKKVEQKAREMVLQVGPRGEVLLRGTISAIGTTTLSVKGWGGDWVVNVASAQMLPGADISQFTVGDFVGVQGVVSQSTSWTVDAKLVRNWTAKKTAIENKQELKAEKKELHEEKREVKKEGNTNTQLQIQSILEQIKKIQEQMNAQKVN